MQNSGYNDQMVQTIRAAITGINEFEDPIIKDLVAPKDGVNLDTVLERAVELRDNRRQDGSPYPDADRAKFVAMQINTYKNNFDVRT